MAQIIEQGLQVLVLHIMWRTRKLPETKDVTPDDEKYVETLLEQRDSSQKKVAPFANYPITEDCHRNW